MKKIPRVVIAATQSGSGKTTIVAGLLSAMRQQGVKVQAYKIGPDYIDPGFHTMASGRPAHNLDTWLTPESKINSILDQTVGDADIAIIEGVMGLYDGGRKGISSTAQLAKLLQAPVILVVDAKSMGESAAAIACGFRDYDHDVNFAGVILNRLGSATHEAMIREAMERHDIRVFGALRRDEKMVLPERHLGLVPAVENSPQQVIDYIGQSVAGQVDLAAIRALAETAPKVDEENDKLVKSATEPMTDFAEPAIAIGVARDEAFSFYYPASLRALEELGAKIVPFSPLHDKSLPEVQGIIIGGGYPEMFAGALSANIEMRDAIAMAGAEGMPIYAECGGYMYLMEELQDFDGHRFPMCGVIPYRAVMQKKLQMLGYVEAEQLRNTILGAAGQKLRGHEFHFSTEEELLVPASAGNKANSRPYCFTRMRNMKSYEAGYASKNILGSYLHLHFAGCPTAAASFFEACRVYAKK